MAARITMNEVAVGYNTNVYGLFYTSADGITWTLRKTETTASGMFGVCWSPKLQLLVAVGSAGLTTSKGKGVYYSSTDGITWTLRQTDTALFHQKAVSWIAKLGLFETPEL